MINVQDLKTEIRVTPESRGFSLDVLSSGTPEVPIKIDILLPEKGRFESESLFTDVKAGCDFLLRGDCRIFYNNLTALNIKCPKSKHYYFKNMRGTEPISDNYFVLTATGFSEEPMHFDIYLD